MRQGRKVKEMLIDDGRKCTQIANEMIEEARNRRRIPQCDREVAYHGLGHVFSHFDSRGGSFLVLNQNTIKAMVQYNLMCGWEEDSQAAWEDLQQGSNGPVEIIVCDEDIEPGELLEEYGGQFKAAWIQEGYWTQSREIVNWIKNEDGSVSPKPTGKWTEGKLTWIQGNVGLVLYKGKQPDFSARYQHTTPNALSPVLKYEYRLRKASLGEDACGLAWGDQ